MSEDITKIRIQSKSGDYNAVLHTNAPNLKEALKALRSRGSYNTDYRGKQVEVPFEEIQHIELENASS